MTKPLTSNQYRTARKLRGSQTTVGKLLGVHQVTMTRRETGKVPVTVEMGLAMLSLPELPEQTSANANGAGLGEK